MLQMIIRISLLAGFLLANYSCKKKTPNELKVVNGTLAKGNEFDSVIQVRSKSQPKAQFSSGIGESISFSSCSATIVGDNTLISAAHCFDNADLSTTQAMVDGQPWKANAVSVNLHPNYRRDKIDFDAAVIVFADGTFSEFAPIPVAAKSPNPGDPALIVGYGNFNHLAQSGSGYKRYGGLTITDITNGRIEFKGSTTPLSPEGNGQNVLNSQGDSGGPMLVEIGGSGESPSAKKYAIVGISSSVTVTKTKSNDGTVRPADVETGNYTHIHGELEFFRNVQGAKIAGLGGAQYEPRTQREKRIGPIENQNESGVFGGFRNNFGSRDFSYQGREGGSKEFEQEGFKGSSKICENGLPPVRCYKMSGAQIPCPSDVVGEFTKDGQCVE